MFEDATFETMGTIHTRSRNWMIATFGLNASILAALIAIPLLHPAVLPKMFNISLLEAPPPVGEAPKPVTQHPQSIAQTPNANIDQFTAPRTIPQNIYVPNSREEPGFTDMVSNAMPAGFPGIGNDPFGTRGTNSTAQVSLTKPRPISQGVMEGLLIDRVLPVYPVMAREMRIAGTVQLQATISRKGTIENLRVVSGPPLLQQAAIDAVKQWRYRPYLLNGEPVEVETAVNVDFKLD